MGNTFADWVSSGAIFGIQVFFALVTFALFFMTLLGLMAVIGAFVGRRDEKDDDMDRG